MQKPIIQLKNISKKYSITHERGGYVALRDIISNMLKNPFTYGKSKFKSIIGLEKKEEFWALKNINFSVSKGEIIGVIGRNGAGKSTLLKLLSQITPPTEGEVVIRGSIGSLLEVGTGFHPELSGRENIFLNGAILGMTRKEIASKFDKIVEFAGIGKFLDTPVKFYSSGMYVRLAFSVAAHMEPDILLVDEVLAVGDAEFQKKCIAKMEEITKKDGRTILFVSHNMATVQGFCNKCVLLKDGQVAKVGNTDEVIEEYMKEANTSSELKGRSRKGEQKVLFSKIQITDKEGNPYAKVLPNTSINFLFDVDSKFQYNDPSFDVTVRSRDGTVLASTTCQMKGAFSGSQSFLITPESLKMAKGDYRIDIALSAQVGDIFILQDLFTNALSLIVEPGEIHLPSWMENSARTESDIKIFQK